MQDETPENVVCSHCGAVIVPAPKIHSMRQREIDQAVYQHACRPADESKRDFQDEVR